MNRPTGWILSIVLSLAGLALPAARAEEAPAAPGDEGVLSLGLDEAVAMALAASPRLGELRAMEEASGAALQLARAERKPLLELAAGYSRLSSVPEFGIPQPDGSTDVIFPDVRDSFVSRLAASLPVYAGGALAGAEEAAGWDLEAAARDVESARADLVLETTVAYWAAVTTREAEGVLREGIASFEAHLADARNRERFGMAARSDVLAVQVERDRAELERLRAENARRTAEADLVRLLGLPPEGRVAPREALEPAAPDARGLESLLADALARRPERASLEARIAAAESRIAVAGAGERPRVSLAAGFDYANPNRRIVPVELDWEESWDLSVSFSMSLWDAGRAAASAAAARAAAEAARRRLEGLDRGIRLEVTARLLDLGTSLEGARVAEGALEAARENRRVCRDRYREGLIPSSELLDAELALLRAGLDRTLSIAGSRVAAARLARAAGR